MTKITVYKSNGQYAGFSCMGHAGYAAYSKDIVCASISILVINTINSIEKLTEDIPQIETDEKTGYISCTFSKSLSEQTILLMDAMILGLTEVKKQYGKKYVDVKFEEV
ncbi:MAG: ribosomal-processing cysteine protease Prp [Lachnospiraceae bacterium]|nr:ribosomal-processing cysteine protease Prp [Lachnospiraceae bacterium]